MPLSSCCQGGFSRRTLGLFAMIILAAIAAVCSNRTQDTPTGSSRSGQPITQSELEDMNLISQAETRATAIPPIDQRATGKLQTATFALG